MKSTPYSSVLLYLIIGAKGKGILWLCFYDAWSLQFSYVQASINNLLPFTWPLGIYRDGFNYTDAKMCVKPSVFHYHNPAVSFNQISTALNCHKINTMEDLDYQIQCPFIRYVCICMYILLFFETHCISSGINHKLNFHKPEVRKKKQKPTS